MLCSVANVANSFLVTHLTPNIALLTFKAKLNLRLRLIYRASRQLEEGKEGGGEKEREGERSREGVSRRRREKVD